MTIGKRLALVCVALAGLTAYMAYLGASSSWRYYATVDECLSNLPTFADQRIRVSGKIVASTLEIAKDKKEAKFSLCGTQGNLSVICTGMLPDNLAEDRDVVAEGVLDKSGVLRGDKILTQCASKYQSNPSTKTTQ
jgi:cytochrome c-type biogenesis protein CcmE